MNLFATVAANSLGIARAAIDDFVQIATKEGSTQSPTLLRDRAFDNRVWLKPRLCSMPPALI